nr:uncharacterized protein LOC127347399 [Lolium perenne]
MYASPPVAAAYPSSHLAYDTLTSAAPPNPASTNNYTDHIIGLPATVAVLQPDGELEQLQAVVGVSDADISSYPASALECVFKETLRMHPPGVADDPEPTRISGHSRPWAPPARHASALALSGPDACLNIVDSAWRMLPVAAAGSFGFGSAREVKAALALAIVAFTVRATPVTSASALATEKVVLGLPMLSAALFNAHRQVRHHHQRRCCQCWSVLLSTVVESATDVVWRCYQSGSEMIDFFLCYNSSAMLLKRYKCFGVRFPARSPSISPTKVSVTCICNLEFFFCYDFVVVLLQLHNMFATGLR